MKKYILRRLMLGVIVLLGVVFITFFITRIIPSDPAAKWVGPRATQEQIALARVELGLDKPLIVQFFSYLVNLARGDFGYSLRSHQPVAQELRAYIPATVELVLLATFIAVLIGVPLGIYSARFKDRGLDHSSRLFSVGVVSLPTFWVALFLQLLFYSWLEILPLGGRLSTEISIVYDIPHVTGMLILDCLLTGEWFILKDALLHIILPGITVALYPIGLVARMTRSALLEILNTEYILASRSYGLSETFVLWRYALKNSLGPTSTVVTLSIGFTLMNTFLIESIFSWPGIGRYISDAVLGLDYPAIMGVTIFSTVCYLLLNLIADLIIALDPRIRL